MLPALGPEKEPKSPEFALDGPVYPIDYSLENPGLLHVNCLHYPENLVSQFSLRLSGLLADIPKTSFHE
jgi:hypothetical protein